MTPITTPPAREQSAPAESRESLIALLDHAEAVIAQCRRDLTEQDTTEGRARLSEQLCKALIGKDAEKLSSFKKE